MKKFWQNNKKIIGFVFFVFLIWTAAINLLDFVSSFIFIPHREGFNYTEKEILNPPFFWKRASFDGIHYLDISRRGYGTNQQVFFPLYPKIIKGITPFFKGRDLLAGLFVSHLSLFLLLFIFYKLILLDFDHKVAQRTLIFLMIFPTSFFFGFVYTESLLLLFILGSFYAARKSSWLIAGCFGFLAAGTRLIGIFLFPALLFEWWQQHKIKNLKLKIKNFIPLLMVPLGLLSYMRFLKINFQDPLMFIHSQPFFGVSRSDEKIVLLYQVFFRYLKMIFTTKPDPLYFTVWLEFLVVVGFIFLLIKSFIVKIRPSYLVFSVLTLLTPTLIGTFSSLPRYVLVLFPCFICLGMIKSTKTRRVIQIIFILSAIFSAVLFFKGYWIA